MTNIVLGGYGISSTNERVQFPVFTNPTKERISEIALRTYKYTRGVVSIAINPEPEVGSFELTIEYEGGNYLPLLSQYLSDGDIDVKSWIEPNNLKDDMIEIGGYFYPKKHTTRNIDTVQLLLITFVQDIKLLDTLMK